jgi:hypothetical protein
VPDGLQQLLDGDTRMQPWVTKVMNVANQCYSKELASNPNAQGVISVRVTMHVNERPDAALASLPPQLAGIVPCASTALMRTRMPLFTGDEGAQYSVRMTFSP